MFGSTKSVWFSIYSYSTISTIHVSQLQFNLYRYDSDNTNVIWEKWSSSGCNYSMHYSNNCENDDPGKQPNNYKGNRVCL